MADLIAYCPECNKRIELLRRVPEGKKIRCLYCGAVFAPFQNYTSPPSRSEKDLDQEEDDFRDRPRRRKAPPAKRNNKVLWGVLGGTGLLIVLICCGGGYAVYRYLSPTSFPEQKEDYVEARKTFKTKLTRQGSAPQNFDRDEEPPPGVVWTTYTSGNHRFRAWVSGQPARGGPKPAVLFLHGGFAFGEGDWDQTQQLEDAGYVVMMPMLRGENGQPGNFTLFYDEVDDVVAAAEALAKIPYVDPNRIYVCGHSAGGTLALLAAMTSPRFKAAASFSGSPDQKLFCRSNPELVVFDTKDEREYQMRSPLAFPKSFKCPVRIYYGDEEFFFKDPSKKLAEVSSKAGLDVKAVSVPGDHFDSVEPAMEMAIQFFQMHQGR